MPYWVHTSVENDSVKTNVISENEHQHKSRDELYEEIEFWRAKASVASQQSTPGLSMSTNSTNTETESTTHLQELGDHANDIIDFYDSYDFLAIKHSSEEEHKPLNPMSVHKMDHYLALFLCFRYIALQITYNSISRQIKEDWKSKHPDGVTKWLSMLDSNSESRGLRTSIQRVINDRVQLFKPNILLFLDNQDSDDRYVEFLTKTIEDVLPGKLMLEALLSYYFKYMWVLRPYVDEEIFRQDIERIVQFDKNNVKPKIQLRERSDFATLASLLVILRYTSVSTSIVDEKDFPAQLSPLRDSIVSVKAITAAQMCLSMYKVLKKTSLQIVQAFLLLRVYFKDCPEDGDGLTLGQSQQLTGFIVESAIGMGLHRDPIYHAASYDIKIGNLKRRLWHSIVSLDSETSVLSGTLSVLPPAKFTNVKLPVITLGDPLERAQIEELLKEKEFQAIHANLCDTINDQSAKPTLSRITDLINQATSFIAANYSMSLMTPISQYDEESQIYRAAVFRNHKILEKNLLQLSMELIIYEFIYVHYEDNKHSNAEMFKLFHKKSLESLINSFDIAGAYISGALGNYINPMQSHFTLFPIISTLTYRIVGVVSATLLRVFYARELLTCEFYSSSSKTNYKHLEKLIGPLTKLCENYLNAFEAAVGAKYHISLKVICSCKFSYTSLKKHRFKALNRLIGYLDNNNQGPIADIFWNATEKDIRENFEKNRGLLSVHTQWMQLSKSYKDALSNVPDNEKKHRKFCDVIININKVNHMLMFSDDDINELLDVLTDKFKYSTVSASVNDVYETFSSGASSTEDFETFYEILSQDPMFNAQIGNVLHKNHSLPDNLKNDFLGAFMLPSMNNSSIFDEMLKFS